MGKKNKLVHLDPTMEMLARMFSGDSNLGMDSSWLGVKLSKWKLSDLAEASTHRATISENNARELKAKLEVMNMMMNGPIMLEQARADLKHKKKMNKHEEHDKELNNAIKATESRRVNTEYERLLKETGLGPSKG